jgi:thiamine-phosphate pyrophosphorylase
MTNDWARPTPSSPDLAARARRRDLLRRAGVYLVTEESLSGGRTTEELVQVALANGVRAIQVREKEATARKALEIALVLRRLTRRFEALLIVNDRIDIAVAADADGVHLGQTDLPVSEARRQMGGGALIGLSITDAAQLAGADAAAADYLGVGAVFPTGSKSDAQPTGLALLGAARSRAEGRPIVAIGGITIDNAAEAVAAGADVVAVISAIAAAWDPGYAATELLARVRAAGAPK